MTPLERRLLADARELLTAHVTSNIELASDDERAHHQRRKPATTWVRRRERWLARYGAR